MLRWRFTRAPQAWVRHEYYKNRALEEAIMLKFIEPSGETHSDRIRPFLRVGGDTRLVERNSRKVLEERFSDVWLNIRVDYYQNSILLGDILASDNLLPGGKIKYELSETTRVDLSEEKENSISKTLSIELATTLQTKIRSHLEGKLSLGGSSATSSLDSELAAAIKASFQDRIATTDRIQYRFLESTTVTKSTVSELENRGTEDLSFVKCAQKLRWVYKWNLESVEINRGKQYYDLQRKSVFSKELDTVTADTIYEGEIIKLVPHGNEVLWVKTIDQDLGNIVVTRQRYEELLKTKAEQRDELVKKLVTTITTAAFAAIPLIGSAILPLALEVGETEKVRK